MLPKIACVASCSYAANTRFSPSMVTITPRLSRWLPH